MARNPEFGGPERRADRPRSRQLLAGKIIIADAYMSPDCSIIELSPKGARVRIPRALPLPPPVGLLVIRDGIFFDAAVAWRVEDEAGLVLKARHDLRNDSDPARRGVRALWAQLRPRLSD